MITLNLWDYNFRQAECSTAYQSPRYVQYVRGLSDFDGITLFTDAYMFDPIVDKVCCPTKVGWLREPRCLWPAHYDPVRLHRVSHRFITILTYDAGLTKLSGFSFVPYGGVWIAKSDWGLYPKPKRVSMLYGAKNLTTGHKLRHVIGEEFTQAGVDFYGYQGTPTDYGPHTKLAVLRDYAFSIVVETCHEDSLFTEILLDCFATATVPILWGAPNIGDFFNTDGIIPFTTLDDLGRILPNLSPDLYESMQPAIIDNLSHIERYVTAEDWLVESGTLERLT